MGNDLADHHARPGGHTVEGLAGTMTSPARFPFHRLLLIAATAALCAAGPPAAPPALPRVELQRVELVSRSGGLVSAGLPLPDGTALVGEGSALVRIDFSAGTPTALAQADLGHGLILDMARSDLLLFALTEEGLAVLPPDSVGLASGFAPGGGQTLAAAADPTQPGGVLVAIAAREAGLRVVQVDAAGAIWNATTLALNGPALDVALTDDGSRAYVAGGEGGVFIVDLSDPTTPHVTAALAAFSPATSVSAAGVLMVVGSGNRVLLVDPSRGSEGLVGTYAALQDGRRIAVQGDTTYVADATDGLKVFWMAAPDRPVQVYGELNRPVFDLRVDGTLAYVVGLDGLHILDISSRYQPREIGRLALPGIPKGLDVTPGRAYVALGKDGVVAVDIENLSAPRLLGRALLDADALAVRAYQNRLFVAAGDAGLLAIDLDSAEAGSTVQAVALPGPALDLAVKGTALYVAAGSAGLVAVDVTHPDAPLLAGSLPPAAGESAQHVTISGQRAFTSQGGSFDVLDVTSPYALGRLAHVRVAAVDAASSGDRLAVLSGSQIAIYDIGVTAEPALLRVYRGLRNAARIAAAGGRVFVSDGGDGPALTVLDIGKPDSPSETDSSLPMGPAYRAWPSGSDVWLALGYGGLRHYGVSEGGALVPRGTYRVVADTARITRNGDSLLVGGRDGWASLALVPDAAPAVAASSPDDLPVRALAQDGDTVAIAAADSGVALYRLVEGGPQRIAQTESRGPATGIALDARFVYAADAAGLSIYDRRTLIATTQINTPAAASGLVIKGSIAYLPLADGRLAIVDLGDPTGGLRSRSVVGTYEPAALVATPGGLVYGLYRGHMFLLNTGNPDNLTVAARGDIDFGITRGLFVGKLLWGLAPGKGIHIYDVRGLASAAPSTQGRIPTDAVDILVDGRVAYVAEGDAGLSLLDLDTRLSTPLLPGENVSVLLRKGNVLFALGTSLTAWDISRPGAPQQVGALPLAAPGSHVAAGPGGDLLLSLDDGLAVARWDKGALTLAGQLATDGPVDRTVLAGSRAYVALHRGGLLVVDLADPASPAALFTYTSPAGQFVHDMLPLDDQTLLVSWDAGIEALDVGHPAPPPHLFDTFATGQPALLDVALSADGSRAALSLGSDGLALLDLSDPAAPKVTGQVNTPGVAQRAAFGSGLDANTLYIADGTCGLRVVDVADSAAPQERGFWRASYAGDVAVQSGQTGSIVYLAEANQVLTLRYDPSAPATPPPVPQVPQPADGEDGVSLAPELVWGPDLDPCDFARLQHLPGRRHRAAADRAGARRARAGPEQPRPTAHVLLARRRDRPAGRPDSGAAVAFHDRAGRLSRRHTTRAAAVPGGAAPQSGGSGRLCRGRGPRHAGRLADAAGAPPQARGPARAGLDHRRRRVISGHRLTTMRVWHAEAERG